MKKIRLLFIFVFGLIFISSFSSCDSPVEKGDIIIEQVENNWLVLEVDNITKESYGNPQNLFLIGTDELGGKTNDYCSFDYFFTCVTIVNQNINLVYKRN